MPTLSCYLSRSKYAIIALIINLIISKRSESVIFKILRVQYFLLLTLTFLFPLKKVFAADCDPENTKAFLKRCSSFSRLERQQVKKIKLWQGTPHEGYQLIECDKKRIKNVISQTGEYYSCEITNKSIKSVKSLNKSPRNNPEPLKKIKIINKALIKKNPAKVKASPQ